jgi:hypothetical protein
MSNTQFAPGTGKSLLILREPTALRFYPEWAIVHAASGLGIVALHTRARAVNFAKLVYTHFPPDDPLWSDNDAGRVTKRFTDQIDFAQFCATPICFGRSRYQTIHRPDRRHQGDAPTGRQGRPGPWA